MPGVTAGLDRFVAEGPESAGLRPGCRIGLAAHAASVDREARHAVELLGHSRRWRLVRLFAPEHGLWGLAQDMERVPHVTDPATGIEVVSLYGDDPASLRPRREHLEDLDAVLVDFQDVGSRYYTYVYTLSYVMEAAREANRPVVVLDRPNPLGGERVEGPVLDPALASFVGRFPLPVRHGLTIGELALRFNETHGIGCDLRVVSMRGWSRSLRFARTGLPWVPPSPNMPSLATAEVYPGACLLEGTNLSEGRGTASPFELAGAPWLDGFELARRLRREPLPGAAFRAGAFRPMFGKHAGRDCGGVQVIASDPDAFRPFATYLVLIREARRLAPAEFAWREEPYEFETRHKAIDLLLGRAEIRSLIERGASLEEMEASWEPGLRAFIDERRAFLLYD